MNIGNTHTQVAALGQRGPERVRRMPTTALAEALDLAGAAGDDLAARWFVASVVPTASALLVRRLGPQRVTFLDASMIADLDFSAVDGTAIGADRLANAVAAVREFGAPVIVLDCGTAITTEAVDRHSRFRGGTIMPGRRLMRRALNEHTGLLPLVDVTADLPVLPGTTTEDAIVAGVDVGLLGAVPRILAGLRKAIAAPRCPVVAVGGDAPFFAANLDGLRLGPDDFTLRGLAEVALQVMGKE